MYSQAKGSPQPSVGGVVTSRFNINRECWLCQKTVEKKDDVIDHKNSMVRGILHQKCNIAFLGAYETEPLEERKKSVHYNQHYEDYIACKLPSQQLKPPLI